MKKIVIQRLKQYSLLVGFGAVFCTLLPLFFYQTWWIDNLSHFRPLYCLAALVCGTCLLAFRNYRVLGVILAIFSVSTGLSVFVPFKGGGQSDDLRLISFNVLTSNQNKTGVQQFIRENLKDSIGNLVFLMEINQEWAMEMSQLSDVLPHMRLFPREDNFGFAILSDLPLDSENVTTLDSLGMKSLRVEFRVQEKPVVFWGVHTLPPVSGEYFTARGEHLSNLAEEIKREQFPVILAGDLNLSPWSPNFDIFIDQLPTSIHRAGNSYDYDSSWRLLLFGTLIDHIFYSDQLRLMKYQVGPSLGSDHSSLLVSFQL